MSVSAAMLRCSATRRFYGFKPRYLCLIIAVQYIHTVMNRGVVVDLHYHRVEFGHELPYYWKNNSFQIISDSISTTTTATAAAATTTTMVDSSGATNTANETIAGVNQNACNLFMLRSLFFF